LLAPYPVSGRNPNSVSVWNDFVPIQVLKDEVAHLKGHKAIAEMTVNTAKRKRGIFTEKEGDSCFCGTDGKHRKNQKSGSRFFVKTGLRRRMDEADRRMAHYYRYVVVITGR
jgi:hypothetical protein